MRLLFQEHPEGSELLSPAASFFIPCTGIIGFGAWATFAFAVSFRRRRTCDRYCSPANTLSSVTVLCRAKGGRQPDTKEWDPISVSRGTRFFTSSPRRLIEASIGHAFITSVAALHKGSYARTLFLQGRCSNSRLVNSPCSS